MSPSSFVAAQDLCGKLNILESKITGSCDPSKPIAERVSNLEQSVHGQVKTGSLVTRISNLHAAVGSAPPTVPSAAADTTLKGQIENDIRLGIKHHTEGRADDAEQAFKRALIADPENVDAHFNIGVLYEETGHLQSALLHYQAAAYQAPSDDDLLNAINSVHRKLAVQSEVEATPPTTKAGLFHAAPLSVPLLQGQTQRNNTAIALDLAATPHASEKTAKPDKRNHPVRQKVLYTAAVVGLAATANIPGGGIGKVILGTVRRSFSCPLCHWVSRF